MGSGRPIVEPSAPMMPVHEQRWSGQDRRRHRDQVEHSYRCGAREKPAKLPSAIRTDDAAHPPGV